LLIYLLESLLRS